MDKKSLIAVAQGVLLEEAEALRNAAESIDEEFYRAIQLILFRKGKVVLTGIGKSGNIARKIASTLSSLGTAAIFIHPTEAYHGDLGMISPGDVCVALSNSGDSEEIIKLIPSLKFLEVPIISITSTKNSELARHSDVTILTKVNKEACSLNLAPTTSTTVSVAIGDALAVALVNAKGFTENDFAFLHPGGALGRKLLRKVSDILISKENVGQAHLDDNVQVIAEQLSVNNLGLVVILDTEGHVQGVVTDGDIRRALNKPNFTQMAVRQIMSSQPKTIGPNKLLSEALRLAEKNRVTALIVADEVTQKFLGVINLHEILRDKAI